MYTFKVAELVSGKILDELPMRFSGNASRLLQNYGSGNLELPTRDPACPETWENLILPWRSLIVVEDDDGRIVWHGVPTRRPRTLSSVVTYPCVTAEAYLARRYMPSRTHTAKDQLDIARDMVDIVNVAGIDITTDASLSGVARDRTYYADELTRVFNALQDLSFNEDGFEWTIEVEWADATQTAVRKIFRAGYPRLGRITQAPEHVFELPGSITNLASDENWGDGEAATHVRAIGDSGGAETIVSAPVVDTTREAAGWPRLEEVEQFPGANRQSTVDGHAQAMAKALFGGTHVISFEARSDQQPRLGDLSLGDSARINVGLPHLNLDSVWRVVGWELTPEASVYKPILAAMP